MRTTRAGTCLSAAIVILLAGCGSGGWGGGSGTVGQSGAASDLQGRWQSGCGSAENFGLAEKSQLDVIDSKFNQTTQVSSSGTCTSSEIEVVQEGTYTRQGEQSPGINALDTSVTRIRVKPITSLGVDILNLSVWCGYGNWALNQEKDVTSRTGADRCFPKAPATYYNIYAVEGGKLYFGKGAIPTSAASRPMELNREREYVRQ